MDESVHKERYNGLQLIYQLTSWSSSKNKTFTDEPVYWQVQAKTEQHFIGPTANTFINISALMKQRNDVNDWP